MTVRCVGSRAVRPVLALAAFAGAAVGSVAVSAQEEAAIAPGVLATPPSALDCAATPPEPAATYTIVSGESEARYRAQEELANVGATEAVGRTQAIIGQILFDEAGLPLACSRFDVDMRTLQSDQARRDNYLYENTLETGAFPLATFVLTAVEGLDGELPDGEETTFTLIGNLTVKDQTRLVAWEATVTREGDRLVGSAATEFDMPDYAIEPPIIGPVVSINETVALEVDITAEAAE